MNTLKIQEAKDITLRYLVALYGQDAGIKMFAESQSRIFDYHGLAWALGKQCFPYFCEIFLHNLLFDYSGDCVPLSDMHYDIWNELNDVILHRNNTRNVYVFPRSFGKSTTITIPLALWCALYCFHPFIVVDSATEKQSENFINTMKVQLEDNHYIKDCFGEIINRNLKYSNPSISSFAVMRNESNSRQMVISANWSFSSVNGMNSITIKLQYKKHSDSSWTTYDGDIAKNSSTTLDITFDEASSYDFKLTITDAVGKSSSSTAFVSTLAVLLDFRAGGKGLGIGKIAETDTMEVALDAIFMGAIYIQDSSGNKVSLADYIKSVASG